MNHEEDPIDDKRMDCPECGDPVGTADQTCQKCGEALSYQPGEVGVHCAVCDAEIGAYAETCTNCGETGYPALRQHLQFYIPLPYPYQKSIFDDHLQYNQLTEYLILVHLTY